MKNKTVKIIVASIIISTITICATCVITINKLLKDLPSTVTKAAVATVVDKTKEATDKEDLETKKDIETVKEEPKKKDVEVVKNEVVENESFSQDGITGSQEQTEDIVKPAKEYITVPEMAGWYPGENDTSGLNIVTGTATLTSSYAARGIVATQSVAPGTEVEKGTTVYISLYSFDNHYDPMTSEHDCELENCN